MVSAASSSSEKPVDTINRPDRIVSYFANQRAALAIVAVSGLIYNVGLAVGPWFEGQLVQCLADIVSGLAAFETMLMLAVGYAAVMALVQAMRAVKRFYVRRFANNVNRSMKEVLYANLVRMPRARMQKEDAGALMTKAVSDVDACVEGMRKFTTELFDTGVVMVSYFCLLAFYDWRLAILSCLFPPIAFALAERMKREVHRSTAAYKKSAGALNAATLDRVEGALVYRVFGCEPERDMSYEKQLADYERKAVRANIWVAAMQPLYQIIALLGMILVVWLGSRNVLGTGWASWDLAAFTAFTACYARLAFKISKTAKLFNSVHQAQVSWGRIKPLMKSVGQARNLTRSRSESRIKPLMKSVGQGCTGARDAAEPTAPAKHELELSHVDFAYPQGETVLCDVSFDAHSGQVVGVTGAVASGKSTLGKLFLCEHPYGGSIKFDGEELASVPRDSGPSVVAYLGHDPELLSDTIKNNILMGAEGDIDALLRETCLADEISSMEDGVNTMVGSGGLRLSGGQQSRVALARTLCHARPIMVLDDPFSAVDAATEQELFAQVKETAKDDIVLLISHRLWLFPQLDKIVWLEDGQATVGTHDELLDCVPEYAALYASQAKGGDSDVNTAK